jgi:hypothetical protein
VHGVAGVAGVAGASGSGGAGISLTGGTNTINNGSGGTIQGGSGSTGGDGIHLSGGTTAITNLGTITAGAGGSSYGIRLSGAASVSVLTNAQGGDTPLTYSGALPGTYNIVIQSPSSFGRLAVTSPSGSMAFGVHGSSAIIAKQYKNVLTGVPGSAINNEAAQFSVNGFALVLTAGSTENSWDLLAWLEETATEPGTANRKLSALQTNHVAVRSMLTQRAAATTFALDYDCAVFDQHGLCVSVGFRNAQIGGNYADSGETAGLLAAAYRVTPEIRIGGFIDQDLVSNSPVGVEPKKTQPMLGAFAVYQANPDFSGLTIRAALAYQEGDLRITRPETADAGLARTSALAFGGELAYGFPINSGWLAQPYIGLRRSDSQRHGYTEIDADSTVADTDRSTYPITYNRFGLQVTSATAGLRLRGAITPEFSLTFGAGMEYDLSSDVDRYTGRTSLPTLPAFSINVSQEQNEVRAVGSAGMRYMIASNQALAFDASVRQMPYGHDPYVTTMLRYSIGF